MKLGLGLPVAGERAGTAEIARVGVEAERIGLDSVWSFERLLYPVAGALPIGGTEPNPLPDYYMRVFDPIETLAYLAAKTSTITLGTSVVDVLLHSPIVLARRLATLDQLCGGRLMAGIGVGWMVAEFEAAGVPTAQRGKRMVEHIAAMRAVWGPDPVAHEGTFYRIEASKVGPKPVSADGVQLLAGSLAPAAVERAGRLGVGFNPIMMGWEALEAWVPMFRSAAEEAGRDPESLPVVVRVNGTLSPKPVDDREPLTGSVDQVMDDLARAAGLGVDHVLWGADPDTDQQLGLLAELREAI